MREREEFKKKKFKKKTKQQKKIIGLFLYIM